MFVADDRVIYSASDLAAAARCEYALLRSFDAKLGRGEAVAADDDELLGAPPSWVTHTKSALSTSSSRATATTWCGSAGPPTRWRRFAPRPAAPPRRSRTGPPVVYQAALFDDRFVGFADFVVLDGDRYRLLRHQAGPARPRSRRCCRSRVMPMRFAPWACPSRPTASLILGDRSIVDYPVDDLIPVYRQQRDQLRNLLDRHLESGAPVAWTDPAVRACMRCEYCVPTSSPMTICCLWPACG